MSELGKLWWARIRRWLTGRAAAFVFGAILTAVLMGVKDVAVQSYSKRLNAPRDSVEERARKLEIGERTFDMRRKFDAGWADWEAFNLRYKAALATDTLPAQRAWWAARIWEKERNLQVLEVPLAEIEGRPPRVIALRDSIAPAGVTDLRASEYDPWYQQYATLLDYYYRAHHKEK